jgi:deoxyuridine 5'-triphosphate nucleotidohydrolase
MLFLNFCKTRKVKSPEKGHDTDAGIDFFVPYDFEETDLYFGEDVLIPSGIKMEIPSRHVIVQFNKSGIVTKEQLIVGACVIDEGYQGEIHLHVINIGEHVTKIFPGMKIMQGLLLPVPAVRIVEKDEIDMFHKESSRGVGGFGSTTNYPGEPIMDIAWKLANYGGTK